MRDTEFLASAASAAACAAAPAAPAAPATDTATAATTATTATTKRFEDPQAGCDSRQCVRNAQVARDDDTFLFGERPVTPPPSLASERKCPPRPHKRRLQREAHPTDWQAM